MSWSRREFLATLSVASQSAILLACGGAPRRVARASESTSTQALPWLQEAVALLVGAGLQQVQALGVASRRTVAAFDVLGAGVARHRCEGVVLAGTDVRGTRREQVTNDLSRDGALACVRALLGLPSGTRLRSASIDTGAAPGPVERFVPDPDALTDGELLARVGALAARDRGLSSRIVYAASVLDIDDAHVWSVAPGRSLEQRLVRVRRSISRVAWHGTRPFTGEAARAWTGGIDAQDLTDDELVAARDNALTLLTPTPFDEKTYLVALAPDVGAALIDAATRAMLVTTDEARPVLSERLTLVDDPTVRDAYGSFHFDDAGAPASAVPLVEAGRVVGRIERGVRAGHLGRLEMRGSHIRVAPGTTPMASLLGDGMLLEGHQNTLVDPSGDRFVIQVARAREYIGGRATGRQFADIEIVGQLTELFGSLENLSTETRRVGHREERDGLALHRSFEMPWLAGRALLRQRRSPS